jgi:hypothetical protein
VGTEQDILVIEAQPNGKKHRITARWHGEPVHIDTLDPANAAHRHKFIMAVLKQLPQADGKAIDAELLQLADKPFSGSTPAGGPDELDIKTIIRPEQFFTPEVSGLAVPVVTSAGGEPVARLTQYLRWADGSREKRELSKRLDLAGGATLWVHPTPGVPSVSTFAGWSGTSRRAWLDGAPAPHPVELFQRLCQRFAYFLDFAPGSAEGTTATLALWCLLTYVYQAWGAVPYLYVGGPLGSGKSRVFEVLFRLAFRALATANLTAPALFRTLHDRGGTLLFDEAERLKQGTPDQQEILSMFLAGYRRGGQAMRLEPVGDSFRPVSFDVFGPKALACIAGLPPNLASRCIPVMMFRAGPDSPKPTRRIDADAEGWQQLRDDLHVFALEHGAAWLDLARRTKVCPPGISGRAAELWQPLLALAWFIENHGGTGLFDVVTQHALQSVEAGSEDQTPEADEVLLEVLKAFIEHNGQPTPGEILERAKERDPGTFDRWVAQTVSRRLKNYGIAAPKKSHGQRRYRDVTLKSLERIQRHYGIDLGFQKTDHLQPPASPPVAPLATLTGAVAP